MDALAGGGDEVGGHLVGPVGVGADEEDAGAAGAGGDGVEPEAEVLDGEERGVGELEDEEVEGVVGEEQLVGEAVDALAAKVPGGEADALVHELAQVDAVGGRDAGVELLAVQRAHQRRLAHGGAAHHHQLDLRQLDQGALQHAARVGHDRPGAEQVGAQGGAGGGGAEGDGGAHLGVQEAEAGGDLRDARVGGENDLAAVGGHDEAAQRVVVQLGVVLEVQRLGVLLVARCDDAAQAGGLLVKCQLGFAIQDQQVDIIKKMGERGVF